MADLDQDIASQCRAIAEFAAAHGITVARWFVDEAESGSSTDRDQFARLIAKSGIFSPQPPLPAAAGIPILNVSRLGRDQQMSQFLIGGFRSRSWLVVPIQKRESVLGGPIRRYRHRPIVWSRCLLEDLREALE